MNYDLVVIGAGPAGEKGAAQAAYFGKRVAVIEKALEPGGAAVHTGTLPSKTLRETALYLSSYRNRDLYGVSVALERSATVAKLIARKHVIEQEESARIRSNLTRHKVDYYRGLAHFVDERTVAVAQDGGAVQTLEADHILIATGSTPRKPSEVPIEDPDIFDSDEILQIDRLPSRLVVLGGGVIACEYACMFAALGVAITLVDSRPTLLSFLDEEMVKLLSSSMTKLGIELRLGSGWRYCRRTEDGAALQTVLKDETVVGSDAVLFASGRVGNTGSLGLAAIGVEADERGYIKVDAHYRTSKPHIYAAGDVIGFPALASVSMDQARVAACHAFDLTYKQQVGRLLPYGIYTIPEVSYVGLNEQEATAKGIDFVVGKEAFIDNPRGKISGDVDGMLKLLVERGTRKIIGVHIIGDRASELVHVGQAVMHLEGTVDTFIEMVFNYPTLGDAYKYAAYSVLGKL